MIEKCPSGALTFRFDADGDDVEPLMPPAIAVTDDGPLWVTGGIPVNAADGQSRRGPEPGDALPLWRVGQQAPLRRVAQDGGVLRPVSAPEVVAVPDRERYEVRVDDQVAGFTKYVVKNGRHVFVHTEIDPTYEGQGLGSVLAQGALDDMRRLGARVVPLCPFIAGWIERHPEYDDLVDHEFLARFEA